MTRINPFRPGSPVSPGMFEGRLTQLTALNHSLMQARAGLPKSFMVTGERGIGKTSLLLYFKYVAKGDFPFEGCKLNFLVLEVDLYGSTTSLGLVQRIERAMNRELGKNDKARKFLADAWGFISRFEAAGIKLRSEVRDTNEETLLDEFAYSLAKTINRMTQEDALSEFETKYDGVVLLIDEADNAPQELQLGSLLKLLTERLQRHGCSHFMIGLAGLPRLRDVLRQSHASSPRIFDEQQLDILTNDEVSSVIDSALNEANKKNEQQTTVDYGGRHALINLSEGYPHFIQQFGDSAFAADKDGIISHDDVIRGALGTGGAIDTIGNQYYRDDFYNKIQKESYRQVLRIMADNDNRWVSKKEIRGKFKSKGGTLDNAIHALRDRKIILSKEGVRGIYRLQHRGFAHWIKLFTTDDSEIQTLIEPKSNSPQVDQPTTVREQRRTMRRSKKSD